MYECFAYINISTMCVPSAFGGQKEGIGAPEAGVLNGCEPPCVCWELNPGTLQKLAGTLKLSLQILAFCF